MNLNEIQKGLGLPEVKPVVLTKIQITGSVVDIFNQTKELSKSDFENIASAVAESLEALGYNTHSIEAGLASL